MSPPGVAGVTLPEFLVATALTLLLAGSLLTIAASSHGHFGAQPAANEVQQRTRVAADAMARALREAGSGPLNPLSGLPLGAVVPCVLPYRVGLRHAHPAGSFLPDLITLITASPGTAAPRLSSAFHAASGGLDIAAVPGCPAADPSCGLTAGASVVLVDPSGQWDLYGVASVVGSHVVLEGRGVSSGRPYPVGTWMVPVDVATFYLRSATGPEGAQLARYDGYQSDLPQIDHVVSLAFEYFGDPEPPRLRPAPGALGQVTTYGPAPPALGEDDERDSWGAGENCVITAVGGAQAPRLAAGPGSLLQRLAAEELTDGPWCPDGLAPTRFDADLLRVRKVRVRLRAEAWADAARGADPRFFHRPGTGATAHALVPDQEIAFDVVPRALGGGR